MLFYEYNKSKLGMWKIKCVLKYWVFFYKNNYLPCITKYILLIWFVFALILIIEKLNDNNRLK